MTRRKANTQPAGRKNAWGEQRSAVSVKFPMSHRARYDHEAASRGLSLNEYVIRLLAAQHGIEAPPVNEEAQLALGA